MQCKISVGFLLLVAVHYVTAVSICPTREITLTQGEVTSPNYPSNYPSNADCSLTIDGGRGARFTVKFDSFEVEEDEDDPNACKYDVFAIIDGSRTLKYCAVGIPEDFTSTGNKIILGFKSDSNIQMKGFRVILSTEIVNTERPKGAPVCPTKTMKINSQEKMTGAIYSPNFPDDYPNNQKCTVTLDVPDNYMTVLSFQAFALQYSPTCSFDQLVLSDDLKSSTQCGGSASRVPDPLELKGRKVKIAFTSDDTNTASGFQLHYNITRLQEGQCICTNGLSYFTINNYKSKNNRQADDVRFEMKTTQSSGMIMYAKGFYRDFIYVAYKDSSILLYHIDLGTGEGKIRTTNVKLNDNQWHKVHITRTNRAFTISIDDGRASAVGQTPGGFNRLDIPTSTGYFLGAPSSLNLVPNFFGCIRNFIVDGVEPVTNSMAGKPDYTSVKKNLVRNCSPADQLQ